MANEFLPYVIIAFVLGLCAGFAVRAYKSHWRWRRHRRTMSHWVPSPPLVKEERHPTPFVEEESNSTVAPIDMWARMRRDLVLSLGALAGAAVVLYSLLHTVLAEPP